MAIDGGAFTVSVGDQREHAGKAQHIIVDVFMHRSTYTELSSTPLLPYYLLCVMNLNC